MSTVQITDDEVGKKVVANDGEEVGIVSAVEHGTAYVDPDPSLTTKLKTTLNWDDHDQEEDYPLQEAAVEAVTDDEIRLRSDL